MYLRILIIIKKSLSFYVWRMISVHFDEKAHLQTVQSDQLIFLTTKALSASSTLFSWSLQSCDPQDKCFSEEGSRVFCSWMNSMFTFGMKKNKSLISSILTKPLWHLGSQRSSLWWSGNTLEFFHVLVHSVDSATVAVPSGCGGSVVGHLLVEPGGFKSYICIGEWAHLRQLITHHVHDKLFLSQNPTCTVIVGVTTHTLTKGVCVKPNGSSVDEIVSIWE